MRPLDDEPRPTDAQARPLTTKVAWLASLVVIGLAVVAGWRLAPRQWFDPIGIITEWTLVGRVTPFVLAIATMVFATHRRPGFWSQGRGVRTVLLAGLGWFGGACGLGSPFNAVHLGDDAVEGSDGGVYRVYSVWWTLGLVRRVNSSWDASEWEPIAVTGTDTPRQYALPIAPRERSLSELEITADNVIADAGGASCYFAYRIDTQTALTGPELRTLSPFLFLMDDERGAEPDLERLEAELIRARDGDDSIQEVMLPSEAVLLAELDSDNPWIREAAARLVVAGGERRYPQATRVVRRRK